MLDQVRTGEFKPDSTRSGCFDLKRNDKQHAAMEVSGGATASEPSYNWVHEENAGLESDEVLIADDSDKGS